MYIYYIYFIIYIYIKYIIYILYMYIYIYILVSASATFRNYEESQEMLPVRFIGDSGAGVSFRELSL